MARKIGEIKRRFPRSHERATANNGDCRDCLYCDTSESGDTYPVAICDLSEKEILLNGMACKYWRKNTEPEKPPIISDKYNDDSRYFFGEDFEQ